MATVVKRRSLLPRSIRSLLVLRLVLVLIPVLVLQLWLSHQHVRAERRDELAANLEIARAVRAAFEAFIGDIVHEEEAIGNGLIQLAPFTRQQANSYLASVVSGYREVRSVSWLDPDGRVLASSGAHLVGTRWADGSWLPEIQGGRGWVVTDVTRPREIGDASFEVASGVKDRAGKLLGIVVAVMDPNKLDRVISVKRSGGGAVSLVDRSGWLAFRLPAFDPPYGERDWSKLYDVVRRALGGEEAKDITYVSYQQGQRIVAEVPIPTVGWAAGAGRPEEEVVGPLHRESARAIFLFLLVGLLGMLLATAAARQIVQPLTRLRRRAIAFGRGESWEPVDTSGPAEVVDLANAFNRMSMQLDEREEALRGAKEELEIRVRERTAELERANVALQEEVAERKRAEEAVGAERHQFNDLLEMLPAYLVLLTPDYQVSFANRFFRERFGEDRGRRCFEYLFGRGEPCEVCETYHALETMAPHQWEWTGPDGRNYDVFDFPFIDTDGSTLIMEVGLDVTERKRAEAEVRILNAELEQRVADRTAELDAAQRLLQTIVENTDTHLVYLDRDFNFIWVNSAYARACRRAKDEFIGHNHFEFYPHEENEAIFRQVRDTGEPVRYVEKPFVFPDIPERGVTYWDWTLTPLKDEQGEVYALVFSLADVTEGVEQREKLLAAERARAELAETLNREIGHRVKNNLAMAAGLLQMQIVGQSDPKVVATLQDTISRLYAFANVHEQLGVTDGGEVKVLAALRRVATGIQNVFLRENVEVSMVGDEVSYPATVGTNLCIIANELLTNAVKHGGPGPDGQLRVRARLTLSDGRLYFTVWNSGNPVPAELDLSSQSTMGISLVQSLVVGQYRGLFTLEPDGDGTTARVVLSDEALRENA